MEGIKIHIDTRDEEKYKKIISQLEKEGWAVYSQNYFGIKGFNMRCLASFIRTF